MDFTKLSKPIQVSVTPQCGEGPALSIQSFSMAGLNTRLVSNATKLGYLVPTPVQMYSIPIILAGRDLMAASQCRSGKLGAFLLPILHRILTTATCHLPPGYSPECVILTDTQQLVNKVFLEATKLAIGTSIKCLKSGRKKDQVLGRELEEGCNLLVTTPGNLTFLTKKNLLTLASCKFLVVYEPAMSHSTSQMTLMEKVLLILKDTKMLNKTSTDDFQTLIFSGDDLPDDVQEMAQELLHDYLFLVAERVNTT